MLRKFGKVKKIAQDQERRQAPPGQYITDKFPVLTHGPMPRIDLKVWSFRIFGLVEEERTLTWEEFMGLPQLALTRDFHCVTQWSRQDNLWEGVPFREVAGLVRPKPQARFVMVHSYSGYTTNLTLNTAMEEDVLFAHRHDDRPLEAEHGGPMRLVVPSRYGWKSAKWAKGIEFMAEDSMGFWEELGYHNNGDPWNEERFKNRSG
jgi:DMSO/TMAO reductase YedYZ molybdopterin-dependent catalytic subunit